VILTNLRRSPALLLTTIALLTMLVAAPANARAANQLRLGVYDCESYNVTGLFYRESVKLIGGGRYQQAYGRHHAKMIKPTNGTYRIKGSRLIFHGGALRNTPGQIQTQGHAYRFALLLHGKPSGFTCYYVAKP
jgi:hypothetical protein